MRKSSFPLGCACGAARILPRSLKAWSSEGRAVHAILVFRCFGFLMLCASLVRSLRRALPNWQCTIGTGTSSPLGLAATRAEARRNYFAMFLRSRRTTACIARLTAGERHPREPFWGGWIWGVGGVAIE